MNIPPLFNILASAALLSTPLHAQLYTLHGDGVKKTERVVEKADYSDYELVWRDEFDKAVRTLPNGITNTVSSAIRKRNGTSRKTPIAKTAC